MTDDTVYELAPAIRILLRRPLLLPHADPTEFVTVRRNAEKLQQWFSRNTGYILRVEPDMIRLFKLPGPTRDPTHPARSKQGIAFNPHRYAVLCLALAVLEREEAQIDLAGLAEEIQVMAASGRGLKRIDLTDRTERKTVVDVVRLLVEWGVLRLRDGDETAFLDGKGNALYDIRKDIVLQLLAAPRAPSACTNPEELRAEIYPATDEGREQHAKHRVMRRLLEDPVVYRDELDDAEKAYLDRHQQAIVARLREAGFHPEVRLEGIATLDPTGELSHPTRFPGDGTVPQAALLIGDLMLKLCRERQGTFVAFHEVVALVGRLREHFGPYWKQEFASTDGDERLAEEAGRLLMDFKLVHRVPDGYRVRPALARFAARYDIVSLPKGRTA